MHSGFLRFRTSTLKPLIPLLLFYRAKIQPWRDRFVWTVFCRKRPVLPSWRQMDWAFGSMGLQDKAKHLATLYLEDLSDFIIEAIDENFGFSRYAERLGRSANSFEELYACLQSEPTYIDKIALTILDKRLKAVQPKLVCFSVPFPGNLYSAFRCAQFVKTHYPNLKVSDGRRFSEYRITGSKR